MYIRRSPVYRSTVFIVDILATPGTEAKSFDMSLLAHHREDSYRSLPGSPYPGTPYAMDRAVMTSRDVEDAMQFARAGIDGDYFAGTPRYAGSLRSRSPYGGMEHEQNGGAYHHDMCMQDLIRRCEPFTCTRDLWEDLYKLTEPLVLEPTSPSRSQTAASRKRRSTA